jgi:hypothetical protein
MDQGDPALDLQIAYGMSSDFAGRSDDQLRWAIDRLRHDRESVDEHARENRFDATQRISVELDRRGARLRDPRLAPFYPGAIPN